MDDQKKEEIISAIYMAFSTGNYSCALTIFNDTTVQIINETLDEVIELIEKENLKQLSDTIRQLKL